MEKCFRCGASSENTIIYDALSSEGLVRICGNCNIKENLPVLKKAGAVPPEKRQTVYERMTRMSGFNPKEREIREREEERKKQNEDMKQVMDRNFREEIMTTNMKKETAGESNLVRNFHWEMMKARRAKHMSQRQLAEALGESELAIRMAERGMLPRERERLVRKIENYLHIKISNVPTSSMSPAEMPQETSDEVPIEEIKKKFSIRELLGLKKKIKEKEEQEE
jgi:ribosome-binding protein aMBF1 (putative translation factor)